MLPRPAGSHPAQQYRRSGYVPCPVHQTRPRRVSGNFPGTAPALCLFLCPPIRDAAQPAFPVRMYRFAAYREDTSGILLSCPSSAVPADAWTGSSRIPRYSTRVMDTCASPSITPCAHVSTSCILGVERSKSRHLLARLLHSQLTQVQQ